MSFFSKKTNRRSSQPDPSSYIPLQTHDTEQEQQREVLFDNPAVIAPSESKPAAPSVSYRLPPLIRPTTEEYLALVDARYSAELAHDGNNASSFNEFIALPSPSSTESESDVEKEDFIGDINNVPQNKRRRQSPVDEWSLEEGDSEAGHLQHQRPLKFPCFAIVVLLFTTWFGSALAYFIIRSRANPYFEVSNDRMSLDDLFSPSFAVKHKKIVWAENVGDGIFTYKDEKTGSIILEAVDDQTKSVFVKGDELQLNSRFLNYTSYTISPSNDHILLTVNHTKLWRHSYYANYYIYNIHTKTLIPLSENSTIDSKPTIRYATWAPQGEKIAFVQDSDIYIRDLDTNLLKRVTNDGAKDIYNGVPDWIYEEEVLVSNYALWWSPDAENIAFLRFNETMVPEFKYSRFMSGSAYPEELTIKYPKAGYPNPFVTVHIYSLPSDTVTELHLTEDDFPEEDRIVTQVHWATTTHSHLLYKQTNRVQDHEQTILVTINEDLISAEVVRDYHPPEGWVEYFYKMHFLPSTTNTPEYLDVVPYQDEWMHLAVFELESPTPVRFLTTGDFEVVDAGALAVDLGLKVDKFANVSAYDDNEQSESWVYYISTERSSIGRHLYKVNLQGSTRICVTCSMNLNDTAFYSASFSPGGQYYILSNEGPDLPSQKILKTSDPSFSRPLEDNDDLRKVLSSYSLPRRRYLTVESDDVLLNAVEILPPDFDVSQKYPVLFRVYGGPQSQMVSYRFTLDWHTILASNKALSYIVVMVDGRGTGFKGRSFRVGVHGKLGLLETRDQVNAGKYWAQQPYVDSERMAIWGWSYGGYMTSKVIESDSGVFAVGMAVAPVTDWLFYDSIYTERYMQSPETNQEGYEKSAVRDMTGFKNANYLLVHGTGDDNVHFQHTAALVDAFTQSSVHSYQTQFYTDNDHAINYHGANKELYFLMTEFLFEGFGGEVYNNWRKKVYHKHHSEHEE